MSRAEDKRKRKATRRKPKKIEGELLLRYRAVAAELSEAQAILRERELRLQVEKLNPKYKQLLDMMAEVEAARKQLAEAGKGLKEVQDEIGKAIKVKDVAGWIINTDTGAVYRPEDFPNKGEER